MPPVAFGTSHIY